MFALGNDIIDWAIAGTQHQKLRLRCLEKLFHAKAIEIIQSSNNSMQTFWILWSVKESAYKAWQRETKSKPIFNPLSFELFQFEKEKNCRHSQVKIDDHLIKVKTEMAPEYIYSYCESNMTLNTVLSHYEWSLFKDIQSDEGWILKKQGFGIPVLEHFQTQKKRPLSISHDGRFYAISLL